MPPIAIGTRVLGKFTEQRVVQFSGKGAQKKLGGIWWWLTLGLLFAIDIVSFLCTAVLQIIGLAISATIIGVVLGLPLSILGWIINGLIALVVLVITTSYFWMNKVHLMDIKKLAVMGLSVIIEAMPLLGALPTATLSFVIISFIENIRRGKIGMFERVAMKAAESK